MSNENAPYTGYPSVDKPWLKYYSEETINAPLPECSIYEYLWENNKDYPNDIAINYYGRKITYQELFDNIDATARGFAVLGVKPGDIVTIALQSVPEALYAVYALNKLGAVANMIHPLAGEKEIVHYLNEVESTVAVLFDGTYEIMGRSIGETRVKHAIIVSAADSLPGGIKLMYGLKHKAAKLPANSLFLTWRQFISAGKDTTLPTVRKNPEEMAIISHTGGTTGEPKGVMCSDKSVNAIIWQVGTVCPHKRQEKMLVVLPPFINYSLVNSMLEPLALGVAIICIPNYKAENFDEYIKKYQPNHINSIPPYWEAALGIKRRIKLSCLKHVYYGGEGMSIELEKRISDWLKSCGSQGPLNKGFGETELISSATLSYGESNVVGSVGIPLIKVNCKIVKEDTLVEVLCGQEGEICFSGPTVMLGYYKNPAATCEILKKHADGQHWIHTGDIGHMNEDGVLFVTGRIKRIMITRGNDGNSTKLFPDRIERALYMCPAIELCCVVGVPDTQRIHYPKAYAVLKPGIEASEQLTQEIQDHCRGKLPEYMVPEEIEYRAVLPRTERGKIDYRALEKEAEDT